MERVNSKNSNYKISANNEIYKSLYCESANKMIIGVPVNFDTNSEETSLIVDNQIPYVDIPNYYERLLRLSKDKTNMINEIIDYALEIGKAKIHMGKNLEMLFNYIHSREGFSISDILVETYQIIENESDVEPNYNDNEWLTSKITNYNKMKKTATFKEYNLLLAGLICAYNFISPSFIEKGKGYLYVITEKLPKDKIVGCDEIIRKYLQEQYKKYNSTYIDSNTDFDNIYDIEYCLNNLVGIKGKYEKIEMHCMYKFIHLDKIFSGLVDTLLNKK